MDQLICHLLGDYVLQNHWMATKKVEKAWIAGVHALVYSLPFLLFLGASPLQWFVIAGTHFAIDHMRLASYWVRFWGVGTQGRVMPMLGYKEAVDDAPIWLSVWLLILVDNTMHLSINYLALRFL